MDETGNKALTIKNWSPEDRPREKLLLKGKASLSDAELIAILIGSGTIEYSAVEVARKALQAAQNDLHTLASFTVKDLVKIKGIGEARAIAIVAALELGRRRTGLESPEKIGIARSQDAYELLKPHLLDISQEAFWVVFLNRANKVIGKRQVSLGGVSGTVADPKVIYKAALDERASAIVVAHNHPSGNLKASQADLDLTKKLKEGGKLLEIQLLDHLIIGGQKYFSFADEGLL